MICWKNSWHSWYLLEKLGAWCFKCAWNMYLKWRISYNFPCVLFLRILGGWVDEISFSAASKLISAPFNNTPKQWQWRNLEPRKNSPWRKIRKQEWNLLKPKVKRSCLLYGRMSMVVLNLKFDLCSRHSHGCLHTSDSWKVMPHQLTLKRRESYHTVQKAISLQAGGVDVGQVVGCFWIFKMDHDMIIYTSWN